MFSASYVSRCLLAISLTFAACVATAAPRIAVVDFENKSQHGGWRVGRGAADILTTELVKGTDFEIFEREQVNSVLEEQNFGQSARVDPATAAKLGKIIGVEYIVTGAVTEYGQSKSGGGGGGVNVGKRGYYASVDVRIIDVNTGRIMFADSGSGEKSSVNVRVFGIGGGEKWNEKHATQALRNAIQEVSGSINGNTLVAKNTAPVKTGPILLADVAGRDVILNAGSDAGLQNGQFMVVKRKGREIKDPSTGKVLKVIYQEQGRVELTNVASSYAEGVIVEGTDLQVSDLAELE